MVKLTENMILKLSKSTSLQKVRKLNAWACNLTDISILKKVPNLTIASLSTNQLSSLVDLSTCHGLEELYLRRNNIQSLTELRHLQNLQNLRVLWLEGSPCTETFNYRLTVLHLLPQLQRLDNLAVDDSEIELARELNPFPSEVTKRMLVELAHHSNEVISDTSCRSTMAETILDDLKSSGSQLVATRPSIEISGDSKQDSRLLSKQVTSAVGSRSQTSIANILQAVLCLLSELDHDNLEAVSQAVRGHLARL